MADGECLSISRYPYSMCSTNTRGRRDGLVVNDSDSGSRGQRLEPHSGRRVVFLSKTYLPKKKYWLYPGSGGSVPTGLKNCLA